MTAAAQIVASLGLEAHPEGGYFRETYRAVESVETRLGSRSAATAILFLVTAAAPSRFRRLLSEEIWLYQSGAPLELVMLPPQGAAQSVTLGQVGAQPRPQALAPRARSLELRPQALVPALTWQAARVAGGSAAGDRGEAEEWSLVSCVVTPGFEYEDFELGRREDLVRGWPDARELILTLT